MKNMTKTVFDVIIDKLNADISANKEFLAAGGVKDFIQYKEVVGLIRGLESCIDYVKDLSRNYMDEDDD